MKAIDNLPEPFKTITILRDIQELSYDDISTILDIPMGTVKSRVNRARLKLQETLSYLRE
jgi:RNA polymerase sigma-70 factor (ECF subfamily)